MIHGIDNLLAHYEELPETHLHFVLKNGASANNKQGHTLYVTSEGDISTKAEGIEKLSSLLYRLTPKKSYTLLFKTGPGQSNGSFSVPFFIPDTISDTSKQSMIGAANPSPYMSKEEIEFEIEKRVKIRVENEMMRTQLEMQGEQIKELQANSSSNAIGEIAKTVAPYVPSLMNILTGGNTPPAMAGQATEVAYTTSEKQVPINQNTPNTYTMTCEEKLKYAIDVLSNHKDVGSEEKAIDILYELSKTLHVNPHYLSMIKSFLKLD